MISSWNSLIWASIYNGVDGRGTGMEWVMAKGTSKKRNDTLVEFRVTMTSTCTHKGPIFYYKA